MNYPTSLHTTVVLLIIPSLSSRYRQRVFLILPLNFTTFCKIQLAIIPMGLIISDENNLD